MITAITTVFALFTSGAGGGMLGGIFGLFKQSQERKERVEMSRINLERDALDYANAKDERNHELIMLEKGAGLALRQTEVEIEGEVSLAETTTEGQIQVAHQQALGEAQAVLKDLNTTTSMDNYRAGVRPTLAYWAVTIFTLMLIWAFFKFGSALDADIGKQILLGLFGTLTFTVTSIVTFYYVARRNPAPKL